MKRRCIVHIDIDAFFAAVEELLNPSLKGKPVIVGGLPHERGVASTANYEARKYGIHSGMPLAKAYKLCPHGVFVRGNYQVYSTFSKKMFSVLAQYTPDLEEASLDEAYLDLTRCALFIRLCHALSRRSKTELKSSWEFVFRWASVPTSFWQSWRPTRPNRAVWSMSSPAGKKSF